LLAAVCLALLAGAGCGDRPRSNPLDPQNPETGGGPQGFHAVAGNARVDLVWRPFTGSSGLLGFRVERRAAGDTAFVLLGVFDPLSGGVTDADVVNDSTYRYRIAFVLADSTPTGRVVEARARPGPEIAWVSDAAGDFVARLTPDGRERSLTLPGLRSVNRLGVDPAHGDLWVTEPFDQRVHVFTSDGVPAASFDGFVSPNAVAVDAPTRTAWICDEQAGAVERVTVTGEIAARVGGTPTPVDVAADPVDGSAWIVEQSAGRALHVARDGAGLGLVQGLVDPRRVAIDAGDGSIWVTAYGSGTVYHFAATGDTLGRFPGFGGPYGLAVDDVRDRVWVGLDGDGAVVALDPSGQEVVRVAGIPHPRGIAVNRRTGEVWVVSIAGPWVEVLGPDGEVRARQTGFDAPTDVVLDPGIQGPLPLARPTRPASLARPALGEARPSN